MSSTARNLTPTAGTGTADPVEAVVYLAKAVGDRLRADILRVLHQDSYAVGELCELFEVPQPALSHHLKILHQAGLVARRREGNSIFYRRSTPGSAAAALLSDLDAEPVSGALAARIAGIHQQRTERSARFFEEKAAEIRAHQAEICEAATYQEVVLEMVDEAIAGGAATGHILEVGPGSGTLLAEIAKRYARASGMDSSRPMLEAARAAMPPGANVSFSHQDFMTLPSRRRYDALVAAMVIHHQASPAAFFAKAAEILKAGGCLLVVELCLHDQDWARTVCGDTWLGFDPDELQTWAERAGFLSRQAQFLAQKNGFRVQVHVFQLSTP
jgi:DNA-binding transcriptional ArsR family regulator